MIYWSPDSTSELIQHAQHSTNVWGNLAIATGEAMKPEKCFAYFMTYPVVTWKVTMLGPLLNSTDSTSNFGSSSFHMSATPPWCPLTALELMIEYPETRGIPIELIDTHSLRCGGANALALSGFSDTQIQKMGRWRGATFKEYIREQLACYSQGMTTIYYAPKAMLRGP